MALKDKLMTLEDFKAVRDVDVASNSAQFTEIKADLGAQTGMFAKTAGYYINLTTDPVSLTPQTSIGGLSCSIIDCVEGDVFVVNADGASSGRAWGFLDSSNHVLSMADANATVTGLELTAPTNAVKLIINDKGDGMSYKVGNNLISKVEDLSAREVGLSQAAKVTLLTCLRHIGTWTDENAQLYISNLEAALNDDFPTIKVFRGKGTSGANIIDNEKRMLSAPIPFVNSAPIVIGMTNLEESGLRCALKPITSQNKIATTGVIYWFDGSYEWDESLGRYKPNAYMNWRVKSGDQTTICATQGTEQYDENGYPISEDSFVDNSGYFRLLFANAEDMSYELPQGKFSGLLTLQGVTYKLEEATANEFV